MPQHVGAYGCAAGGRVPHVFLVVAEHDGHERELWVLQLETTNAEIMVEAIVQLFEPFGP